MVLPFFCGSASIVSTRPTTSGPRICSPGFSIASSLRPRAVSRAASSSVVTPSGSSTYSRIQETGAFTPLLLWEGPLGSARSRRAAPRSRDPVGRSQLGSEGAGEPDVALEERAEVLEAVPEHQGPVDAHAEGEP